MVARRRGAGVTVAQGGAVQWNLRALETMPQMLGSADPVRYTQMLPGVQTGGEVSLDLTGRKPGRGAYVCRNPECLQKAQKARRFERAFSCRIEDAVFEAMYAELCADAQKSGKDG